MVIKTQNVTSGIDYCQRSPCTVTSSCPESVGGRVRERKGREGKEEGDRG